MLVFSGDSTRFFVNFLSITVVYLSIISLISLHTGAFHCHNTGKLDFQTPLSDFHELAVFLYEERMLQRIAHVSRGHGLASVQGRTRWVGCAGADEYEKNPKLFVEDMVNGQKECRVGSCNVVEIGAKRDKKSSLLPF